MRRRINAFLFGHNFHVNDAHIEVDIEAQARAMLCVRFQHLCATTTSKEVLAHPSGALRQDSRPGNGKAEHLDAKRLHYCNIGLIAMVEIHGHIPVVPMCRLALSV